MIVLNSTKYTEQEILAGAARVGLDVSEDAVLSVDYGTSTEDNRGEFQGVNVEGRNVYLIKLKRDAAVTILDHELRHAYQAQALGIDVLTALYELEEQLEGYEGNVFELDAFGYGGQEAA